MSLPRTIARGKATSVLVLLAAAAGCVGPRAAPDHAATVALTGMSPQSSERYHCGPSTLASVLTFHGDRVHEEDIAAAIYSPSARGTLLSDMAWFARQRGFDARVVSAGVEDLHRAVETHCPPIVLLDAGFAGVARPHFTAITGFATNGVLVLGKSRPDEYAGLSAFTKQWNRAGNMVLFISPRVSP